MQEQQIAKPILINEENIIKDKKEDGSIIYSLWFIDYYGNLYFINRNSLSEVREILNELQG